MKSHQRILFNTSILLGTFCTALVLFAQPQPLPQIPQVPQIQQVSQVAPNGTPLNQAEANGPLFLNLTRMTPEKLEQALRQICGHRFIVESPSQYQFSVEQNNVRSKCSLRIEPQSPSGQARRVAFSGDKQLCDQVFLLISVIDKEPPPKGKIRQIIPYNPCVAPDVLTQALNAYRSRQPAVKPQNAATSRLLNQSDPIRLVEYQFQDGAFDSPGVEIPGNQIPGTEIQRLQPPGSQDSIFLADELWYMPFPLLDAIAIEADGPRLVRFTEMIRQLEELSQLARPEIEIIHLKHVNCAALAMGSSDPNMAVSVIGQVYRELFGVNATTPGSVRIVPMGTPNAILLIGWGEQMKTMRKLIESLDQPTASEHSRLHFFKLKHISASQAQTTIQRTFPAPQGASGFMPRIQTFIDARSNLLIVQADPNDLNELEKVIAEIDVPSAEATLRIKPFKLKNTLAPDMEKMLSAALTSTTSDGKSPALELLINSPEGQKIITSGILSDATVSADIRGNMLIVKAPESCMAFIAELINMLDTGSPEAEVKIFEIVYGNASTLITMLQKLIPSNVEGAPGPQLPNASGEDTLIPIRFAVDERTNCIVATGSPGDLKIVEALLTSLDREDLLSRKQIVYRLKNMKAEDVSVTINKYIADRLKVMQSAPEVVSPYQQIESAVIIVPDPKSNSLIINTTPRYYDEIFDLIEEVDKSPQQVIIKVLIAEILLSDTDEWSSEIGLQDPLMFKRGVSAPGLLFNNNPATSLGNGNDSPNTLGTQLLSNFGGQRVGTPGFGGMVFTASSEYINITLRALKEKKRLEVLSSPTITAMNNEKALISVGQQIPRWQGTNTSYGSVSQNIRDIPVELRIEVQPNISPNGTIVMSISAVNEKLGTMVRVTDDINIPQIDKTMVLTKVSATDNETVLLGGLISKAEDKIHKKIPYLGDIPFLGKMFRQDISQVRRSELLVILTPRIVRTPEEMSQIRQMEMARMSWCLSNVSQTYGDLEAYSVISEKPFTGNAPVYTPGPIKMKDLQPIESTPALAPAPMTAPMTIPTIPRPAGSSIPPAPTLPKKD